MFIIVVYLTYCQTLFFLIFSDVNGQTSFLSWGIIPETLGVASIISTLDGGYAIVYANVTNSSSINPNNLFAVRVGLYAILISRNQQTPSIP